MPRLAKASTTPCRKSGFTLVELLIGMFLGLLALLGLSALMVQSSDSFRSLQAGSAMIDDGRYAANLLANELNHVGFFGHYFGFGKADPTIPAPTTSICSLSKAALDEILAGPFPIQVFDGSSADPTGGCVGGSTLGTVYRPETDVLVVRRAATRETPPADLSNTANLGRWFIQSDQAENIGTKMVIGQASATCDDNKAIFNLKGPDLAARTPPSGYASWTTYLGCFPSTASLDIRELFIEIFFISSCFDCTGSGDGIPTLMRATFTGGLTGTVASVAPLARHIEGLEVYLSGDSTGKIDGHTDIVDMAVSELSTKSAWNLLTGAEVFLLARTDQSILRGDTQQTMKYLLGPDPNDEEQWISTNDAYKRRVFRVHLRLNNLSQVNANN